MQLRPPPRLIRHLTVLSIIGVLHLAVVWALDQSGRRTHPSAIDPGSLITVFIKAGISDDEGNSTGPDLSKLLIRIPDPRAAVHIAAIEPSFFVSRNNAASIAAPSLQGDGREGMEPFVQQAALAPGQGATVVLRIEVLDNGEPGQIAVDVSSGSARIDQAAVDYARARHWYAGRMTGTPHTMWIRWAVRLQA